MKKNYGALLIIIAVFSFPASLFCDIYFSLGGGAGGEGEGTNVSLDLGAFTENEGAPGALMAVGFSYISGVDELPTGVVGDKSPDNNFARIGDFQKDNESAFYGKLGIEAAERLFVFGTLGMSFVETAEVVRSDASQVYYEQASSTTTEGLYGAGLAYFLKDKKIAFQLEYDNRRGTTGSIAFRF